MMNGMIVYAVESSICLTLLWAFHEIALRRDTRHRRNRYYLFGAMLFSLVVPLLDIRIDAPGTILQPGGLVSLLLPEMVVTPSGSAQHKGILSGLLPWIYTGGVIIAAGSIITGAAGLIKLTLRGKKSSGRVYSLRTPGSLPCLLSQPSVISSSAVPSPMAMPGA
ncbi:MAG: hypothetical protein U5L72_19325 [Bacteroidales bacterium]|nr:hypothetical protein [Bacteroidales bacterium]